jgi:uncharacterized protein (DUF1501 family)
MLLVGGKVNSAIIGDHPSLTKIPMGNLEHSIDFRSVYATVLDRWLGVSSKDVLGGEFAGLNVFKS